MKTIKRIVGGLLIAAPLFLAPTQSKANGLGDFFRDLFGRDGHSNNGRHGNLSDPPAPAPISSNSVPLNGGILLLVVAGLGLGTKIMYDRGKRNIDSVL